MQNNFSFYDICNHIALIHSKGQIGLEERLLIFTAFGLMLIIIIPVILMTIYFAIKYRASNTKNKIYDPNWNKSKKIEFIIWTVPIIIIIFLGKITWQSTYRLDPKNQATIYSTKQPIIIDVIALDWKWLFIYPHNDIAVINELVFPANTPVKFNVTSNSVMNSFFIPQLGGQIYAMAGMHTELNLIANSPGIYKGISSNFSGPGFSDMKFTVIATRTESEFIEWIETVKKISKKNKTVLIYQNITQPSANEPITYFINKNTNLFYDIIKKFSHH